MNVNERWMQQTKAFRVAVVYAGMIGLTFIILNALTSWYPWCVYPIFGLMWWPLSVYFAGRRQPYHFALCGTGLLSLFFIFIYLSSTFGAHPWFLYPMLAAFWWPLGVWGAHVRAQRFAIVGAEYVILMMVVINLLTSPDYWWWIYPAIGVIWWPLGIYLHSLNHKEGDPS